MKSFKVQILRNLDYYRFPFIQKVKIFFMDTNFTFNLNYYEANFLNALLPQSHSLQICLKIQKRRKTEKKLDDMFASEFSLRPFKKPKNQRSSQKVEKKLFHENKQSVSGSLADKHPKQKVSASQPLLENKNSHELKRLEKQNQIKEQRQVGKNYQKMTRSQRISKPTEAYLQFQSEKFKKKIIEKSQQFSSINIPQKNINTYQRNQEQQLLNSKLNQNKKESLNSKSNLKKSERVEIQEQYQNIKEETPLAQSMKECLAKKLPLINQKSFFELGTLTHKKTDQKQIFDNLQTNNVFKSLANEVKSKTFNFENQNYPMAKQSDSVNNLIQPIQREAYKSNQPENKLIKIFEDRMPHLLFNKCLRIVEKLKIHKASWPFRHPVDPIKQNVPDYLEVIKNPMDLKTIEKKLKSNQYKTETNFYSDVNLMFQNSFFYNPIQSKYHKLTTELQTYFNQLKLKPEVIRSARKKSHLYGECNSENSEDSQIEEEYQKPDQKIAKQQFLNELKSTKPQNDENKKRSFTAFGETQLNTIQKKTAKIYITNQGQNRKEPQELQRTPITINKILQTNDFLSINNSQSKSLQLLKITKKQQKQIKIEQKKKSEELIQKEEKIDSDDEKTNSKNSQIRQFGQTDQKIDLIQRSVLLYDILNIRKVEIQNQIQNFLTKNNQTFDKYKRYYQTNEDQNLSQNSSVNTDEQQEYDIDMKDLDFESYRLLRVEVNRLMKLDKENELLHIAINAPERLHPERNSENE